MAILGVTEQALLRRVLDATPHHTQCMRDLETFVAELDLDDRQQDLCGEGFESDEDEGAGHAAPLKAPQGVIRCAAAAGKEECSGGRDACAAPSRGRGVLLRASQRAQAPRWGESELLVSAAIVL